MDSDDIVGGVGLLGGDAPAVGAPSSVHLFCATDLYEESASSGENERIEVVRWPLAQLERAIEECRDAKTLIGLLWLARRLGSR